MSNPINKPWFQKLFKDFELAGSLEGGEEGGVEEGGLEVAQPWGNVAGHPRIFYIQDSNN